MSVVSNIVGAVLYDLENVLHEARCDPTLGVAAYLELAWEEIAEHVRPLWQVGCGDRWLVAQRVDAAARLELTVFPGDIGPNRADEELCRRALDVPGSLETVVVASGDGDLVPAVRHLQNRSHRVLVAATPKKCSARLRMAADGFIPLTPYAPQPLAA